MTTTARRRSIRRLCLLVIALLFIFSVPWYRESGEPLRLWLGLPDWVAVALGCYVAVAWVNGVAWLSTDIEEPASTGAPAPASAPRAREGAE